MSNFKVPAKQQAVLTGHDGPVLNLRLNKSGKYLLSCGQDKMVKLWNPEKELLVQTYPGHGYQVQDVAVIDDNSKFASCGGDRAVFVWDVASARIIRKLRGHSSRVNCVDFNEDDNSVLASGSYDGTLHLWDMRSNSTQPIQVLNEFLDSVTGVRIQGTEILTSCVDGRVRVYDIRTGGLQVDTIGPPVTSLARSTDGNCILASALNSTVYLLDHQSGELLNKYQGHKNEAYRVTALLSPEDSHVVCGSEDNMIYIWDLVDGHVVSKLTGHQSVVCGLDFHPEGNFLVSASVDGTVRIWTPG